jgi:hypothetical protein
VTDFPETTSQIPGVLTFELEHGKELSQAPGRDTRAVHGTLVSFADAV